MIINKLDTEARDMLRFLNENRNQSYSSLAITFEERYKDSLPTARLTLNYLMYENLVKVMEYDGHVAMIQISHLGRTYEARIRDEKKELERERKVKRRWDVFILTMSSILSVIVSAVTSVLVNELKQGG